MSQITIQCLLVATESTRKTLWELMAQKNTPLVSELLTQVARHPDFETWRREGKLKAGIINKLCEPLRKDPLFIDQPGRFYTSAIALVDYIFKSWLKLQKRLQRKLEKQNRWLAILKSDEELVQISQSSLETIQLRATEILSCLTPVTQHQLSNKNNKKTKKSENTDSGLFNQLHKLYDETTDNLTHCAIRYLLKNGCRIPQKPENPQKFDQRCRKVEIKIERLIEQMDGSIPTGRDLTGNAWLETLAIASITMPQDAAEAKSWQDQLLTQSKSLPYPVAYESNEDLKWSKNKKGRFCVQFNGLGKHIFEVYCDQRQLKWFQRFYEDQEIKRNSKEHSSALFTLRSGRLLWQQEGQGKGEPWNVNRLALHCTLDTQFWTEEGTAQIQQEKVAELVKNRLRMKPQLTFDIFFRSQLLRTYSTLWLIIISYWTITFLEKGNLPKAQKDFQTAIKRTESSLEKINLSYSRPHKPLYEGKSYILVGVAMGLEHPATVAVINGTTGQAIVYRSVKQLLGQDYPLLNRQRKQKQQSSHQRHKAQKSSADNRFGESELGQYIDRLLAKAIITLAQTYQAGSIVVPKLKDMRELIQAEIQAKAEQKIPGYIEGQEKYAKQYRMNIHQWSYGRLIENK
ncbi:type V CRISPR-associated protein Cas12k [Aphanothece hegewaldii]|uniref:type V CRISPR-associated protein Cas12k n=1 Tax=Aphanothece hegewaldii TaxID=1521625 RepID=UPI001C62E976|nr:type V CRISPR-associated protein Cas12k [Aphanothece hegewaldii]